MICLFWPLCHCSARFYSGLGVHNIVHHCSVVSCVGSGFLLLFSLLCGFAAQLNFILVLMFTVLCVAARSSHVLVLDLYCFSACSIAFFIFVQLYGVTFALSIYVVVRRCSVISCVDSGFLVASQLVPWLSSFLLDYTTSLLVFVFTASCIAVWLSCVSNLDFLSLLNLLCGFFHLITRRLFVYLTHSYACSCVLCDFHDGTEFTGCVFLIYTLHTAFDLIVSLPLQSTICVNCFSPTPLSRKCQAASPLSSSSSGTESPCPTRQTTSSGFMPVNSMSLFFETKSFSPSVRRKKTSNKRKMAAKEAVRDRNYELPM